MKKKYSRINHLQRYIKIQEIVQEHYEPEISTYSGVWRKYVNPIYPMSYKRFIEIINMTGLHTALEEERKRLEDKENKKQLSIFE